MFPKINFFKFRSFHNFFLKALVTYCEWFPVTNFFLMVHACSKTLKNCVFKLFTCVYLCYREKNYLSIFIKYSELNFLWSPYKISQGLFLSNDVFNTVRINLWKSDRSLHITTVFWKCELWLVAKDQSMLV